MVNSGPVQLSLVCSENLPSLSYPEVSKESASPAPLALSPPPFPLGGL